MATMVTSTRLNVKLYVDSLYCLATHYVYPHLILNSFLLQFYKLFVLNIIFSNVYANNPTRTFTSLTINLQLHDYKMES